MSQDFKDELSARIGAQRSQKKDYKQIISELQTLGEGNQRQKKLNEELTAFSTEAQALEEKGKWKEAGVLYFEGSMVLKEILGISDSTFQQWVDRSSQCMVNLANEYGAWKEYDRASAAIAVANLIHFLKGEWTLLPEYNDFNQKYSSMIQTGKTAAQSMWIPYDLVNAIDQINAEFLQRAESYTQTGLLTETKVTEIFRDAIYTVLADARTAMTSKLKLPNIETTGALPKDIVFGEKFSLEVELKNIGEGDAKNVKVTINKMDGLNLTGGSYTLSFESLNVNKDKNVKMEFVCPSGEGIKERKFDLAGKVEYLDAINNRRQNPIGPYTIIVRAFRKADELKDNLAKAEKANEEVFNNIRTFTSSGTEVKTLAQNFSDFVSGQKSGISKNISAGEFAKAEASIEVLDSITKSVGTSSIGLMSAFDDLSKTVNESKNVISTNLKTSKDNLAKIDKLLNDLENKWK